MDAKLLIIFEKFQKSRNDWKWPAKCLGTSFGCWNGDCRSASRLTFVRFPFGARSAAPRAFRRSCHSIFWVSPKGKLKNKISKKLRLRLARGVEINSVGNWDKRYREWIPSIEFSKSVRDWKPTKFWVDPPELFPTKNLLVFLKKSVWKKNVEKWVENGAKMLKIIDFRDGGRPRRSKKYKLFDVFRNS